MLFQGKLFRCSQLLTLMAAVGCAAKDGSPQSNANGSGGEGAAGGESGSDGSGAGKGGAVQSGGAGGRGEAGAPGSGGSIGGAGGATDGGLNADAKQPISSRAFCDPMNFRPFARDGFFDAATERQVPGADPARELTTKQAQGTFMANVALGGRSAGVYVPGAYEGAKPGEVALMLFLGPDESFYEGSSVYRVLDNLAALGEIPPTIGVFLTTANKQEMEGSPTAWVNSLADIVYPALKQKFPKLSDKPEMHGTAGGSSWGLGAFHVAWFRPDFVRKVLTHSGRFVCFGVLKDYPKAIADSPAKPIRVALTVGNCDIASSACDSSCKGGCMIDGAPCFADWQKINKSFADALKAKQYEYRLLRQIGGHAAFPNLADEMRWLWRPTVCPTL